MAIGEGILDDVFPDLAVDLLNTFGGEGTLIFQGAITYAPKTGVESIGDNTEVELSVSPPAPFRIDLINNTSIRQGDLMTLVAADQVTASIVPNGTKLTIGSVTHLIVGFNPIMSGNEIAAYELQLRV